MITLEYLLIGIGVGLVTSAPVGPVNIMAIKHAAQQGFGKGVTVAFGAVVADTIYAALAVFSVSAVTTFVTGQEDLIKALGGLLLLGFGLRVYFSHPHMKPGEGGASALTDMVAAFLLTVTNPGVILGFVAILGGLGTWRPVAGDHLGALSMVAGVTCGAMLWWCAICWLVSHMTGRIDDTWLERANHIAGALLVVFAVGLYVDLLVRWVL
ncbi:LysE family translocator [Roseibium sp.]|uniref:LysE family translocator n=1 Tax=Roseibium sp. TaxID=1936156 RepID=UPI003A9846F4